MGGKCAKCVSRLLWAYFCTAVCGVWWWWWQWCKSTLLQSQFHHKPVMPAKLKVRYNSLAESMTRARRRLPQTTAATSSTTSLHSLPTPTFPCSSLLYYNNQQQPQQHQQQQQRQQQQQKQQQRQQQQQQQQQQQHQQ